MFQWLSTTMEYVLDFSNILNASIAASWMVLAVIVMRFLLKKAPRWTHVALWGLVAVRLLLPFSIESALSLIPSTQTVPQEILVYEGEKLQNTAFLDIVSNPAFSQSVTVEVGETVDRVQISLVQMTPIWILGMVALLIYTVISYWRLRRKVSEAVILRDNIFQSENVVSPFVLGIIKPKVYLPYNMDGQDLSHVVAHEQAHIRRRDHWWKPLGFLLLTIHWFNPLMWLAYVLLCRDIELACDEKVIKELGNEQRADYTQALVACSVNRRMIAACPLAFGEVGVKERVKSVMNYKKPAFWVIVLAVIACVIVAVCFLTNPLEKDNSGKNLEYYVTSYLSDTQKTEVQRAYNRDNKSISVAVQFEMTEGPTEISLVYGYKKNGVGSSWTYSDPVSLLLGEAAMFTVPADHHFSFSATPLDGANGNVQLVFTENKSMGNQTNSPNEVTPEKITFEAEVLEIHDGYFLVKPEPSWAINSADQIEVPMKNMDPALEPQVGDTIEIVCSGEILETYPARLSKVYGIKVALETSKLSLNDVIMLSQKGYELSWSDFEQFKYIETGSGLYIRVYEINEMYELWIGGSWIDEDPMYIYLALADDLDTRIDIRDGGVTDFIGADHSEVLLTKAIHDAILVVNKKPEPDGLYHCASFALLSLETVSGTPLAGAYNHMETVTVYGFALHQAYGFSGATFHEVMGSHIPVAITFEVVDGKYVLKEYWQPGDGSYYVPDIRERFPDDIEDEALDTQKYILAQKQECYDQAVRYGGVDTYSAVEHLFEVIESSPATSSRPADYIDAHPIEYRELTYYGSYTLQYVFSQFLEGGQTGLRGHLMRSVLDDLAPEAQLRLYAETGQEYFDEWKAGAIRISEQHDMEWIKENQPAIWLLLQMIDE